ncbi:unnamed protein product [Protopolystoma xenopodis]|uniref:Uncharacterized protein n=1 Tax=Protopolystoma xenopodis TaxID=117903 RepID=A0A448X366_9PLAT|nr:unnamed protein product [Protopolystoma xenopodis]
MDDPKDSDNDFSDENDSCPYDSSSMGRPMRPPMRPQGPPGQFRPNNRLPFPPTYRGPMTRCPPRGMPMPMPGNRSPTFCSFDYSSNMRGGPPNMMPYRPGPPGPPGPPRPPFDAYGPSSNQQMMYRGPPPHGIPPRFPPGVPYPMSGFPMPPMPPLSDDAKLEDEESIENEESDSEDKDDRKERVQDDNRPLDEGQMMTGAPGYPPGIMQMGYRIRGPPPHPMHPHMNEGPPGASFRGPMPIPSSGPPNSMGGPPNSLGPPPPYPFPGPQSRSSEGSVWLIYLTFALILSSKCIVSLL